MVSSDGNAAMQCGVARVGVRGFLACVGVHVKGRGDRYTGRQGRLGLDPTYSVQQRQGQELESAGLTRR